MPGAASAWGDPHSPSAWPSPAREGSAGRKETNGRVLTNSRAAASERRSSQPMIDVARRNLHGCRRRNPATTATLSSSDRKRCCGVNDSRPIWTCSAGRTRMFRTQSSVLAPGREDDCLMGLPVVPQDHGSGGVGLAGLASGVDQQQERVAQEPAPSPAIQRQRQPEDHKSETTRFSAKPQQWLRCPAGWVRCGRTPQRHHLRTGANPQLALTPSQHRRRYPSQRRKSFRGLIRPAPNADPSPTLTCAGGPARMGRKDPAVHKAAVSAARPVRRRRCLG